MFFKIGIIIAVSLLIIAMLLPCIIEYIFTIHLNKTKKQKDETQQEDKENKGKLN